ncbi:MAG: LamG-like jellyroll fold domain-containing protein [Opitutaceae bacterium]|jgi:hypothetical protein
MRTYSILERLCGFAILAQFWLLPAIGQVLIPYIADFESAEGFTLGSINAQNGWQVSQGSASIVASDAFSGTWSVVLAPASPASIITQSFAQFTGQTVAFVDFYARPFANADISLSSLIGVQESWAGFVKVGSEGKLSVLDGNGTGSGSWVTLDTAIPIDQYGQAENWIRFTFRQDYSAKKWDLYLDGSMVAHGLGFKDNSAGYFSVFKLQGALDGNTSLDAFLTVDENPLFVDSDKDGLPDSWETQQLGTAGYGPETDPGAVGRTLAQSYQQGLSPWPAPVVADGLRAWYRADEGVIKDGDNKVSLWTDLSGHGFHVVQTDDASWRPDYVAAAMNGHPAMAYDGTGRMALTSETPVDIQAGSSDITVIAVVKPKTTQSTNSTLLNLGWIYDGDAYGFWWFADEANRAALFWKNNVGDWRNTPGSRAIAEQVQILSSVKSGTSAEDYLNGAMQGTSAVDADMHQAVLAALTVGNAGSPYFSYHGQIAEILVYNRALNNTERQAIETALMAKYIAADSDGNGLPDVWENKYFGHIGNDAGSDPGNVSRTLAESYTQGLSPWPAPVVASGLRAWYRADKGVIKNGDNKVSQWTDVSGNGVHVMQPVNTGRQPDYVAAAMNSLPALSCDASAGMVLASRGPVDLQAGSNDITVIAVVKPEAGQPSNSTLINLGWSGQAYGFRWHCFYLDWADDEAGEQRSMGVDAVAGQVQVLSAIKSGTRATDYMNGVVETSRTVAAGMHQAVLAPFAVGNAVAPYFGFHGQIAEILVYNRALTDAERTQVESVLKAKYINPDSDGDGLPDAWEDQQLGTRSYGAGSDPGNVGRTLLQSYQQGLSPWPTPVVSDGLRVWYRADRGVTKDGDNKVSLWTDVSGHGFHVVQTAETSRQPVLAATSMNGQPAVAYDASASMMLASRDPVDIQAGGNDFTVIAVVKPEPGQPTNSTLIHLGSMDQPYGLHWSQDYYTPNRFYLGWANDVEGSEQTTVGQGTMVGQVQVLSAVKNGTSATDYVNGAVGETLTVEAGMELPVTQFGVGNMPLSPSRGFHGEIAEILIYNRALGDAERQSVEAALAAKYIAADSDGNGLPDVWENKYFGGIANDAGSDPGNVGRTLLQSYQQSLSPWPAPVVADGLRAWYRADEGVVRDSNNKVSRWTDVSGQGSHVIQGWESALPSYAAEAINGQPAVAFDGEGFLKSPRAVNLFGGSDATSVVVVFRPDETQAAFSLLLGYDTLGVQQMNQENNQYGAVWASRDPENYWGNSGSLIATGGSAQVMTLVIPTGADVTGYLNGVLQTSDPDYGEGLSEELSSVAVGAGTNGGGRFHGQIAEILVYNRALNNTERQAIETALMTKYIAADSDGNGLPDVWENKYFGGIGNDAGSDPGNVGRTLLQSYQQGLSPWPAPVVADGLRAWYRADEGVTKDGNNKVSQWTDVSGNGSHVLQGLDYAQPDYANEAINGLPALEFNGTVFLKTPRVINLFDGSNATSVVVVFKPAAEQFSGNAMLGYGTNWAAFRVQDLDGINNRYGVGWYSPQNYWANGGAVSAPDGSAHVMTLEVQAGTSIKGYLNGVLQSNDSEGSDGLRQTLNPLFIGALANVGAFKGQIAEILVYNRALSDTERIQVETTLKTKYLNSVSVPANLTAETVSQTQVLLSWSGDVNGTSYIIERQAANGTYQVIATINNTLSYFDTELSAGQTYHYRIKAQVNGVASNYSVTIDATTTAASSGQPPTVALSIDYGSSNFAEPGSISLSAEATSPTSTVAKVDFYAGATKIGTSTGTPYQFEWNDIPAGTYGITAVATDANGLAGTSDTQWANVDASALPPVVLPYATDFEASENYSIGPLDHQNSWIVSWVSTGGVTVINADAFSGTQAIEVQPDPLYTAATQNFSSDPSIPVVYVDFYAKPAVTDDPNYSASFWTESAGISLKRTGNLGEVNVYDAGVYDWIGTGVTVPLSESGQAADWVRFTIRTDYSANTWDLYVNGHMLIANVPAYYASNMSQFLVVGNDSGPTLLDHFSAGYTNPLFADVNNDGLDDVWEQTNGLSLSIDDRQGVQADGSNNLQVYLNSNAGLLGVNLTPPLITSLVDSSGVPGAGGLVSVLITGSDGSPIAYAPVVFTVNGNGALIASASGSGGDSRITVQTDASGVARAYVNFTSASPVDMLVMAQNSITSMATSATQIGALSSLSIHLVDPVIIDFEQAEGYLPGSLDQQQGWSVVQGAASISNQDAYSGSDSIILESGSKILQATLPPLPGKDIVYVDFYAKPAVEDDITKSTTFEIGGARFAFVTSYGTDDGQHATLEAFTGDGQGGGVWAPNSSDINLGWGNVSLTWVRLTARLNYSKKTWDLYLNGKMIAADLGLLDNTITALTSFVVTGSADYQSSLDHIYVGSTNLLFADANNDGIDDLWESQYSLSLSVDDRDLHPSGSNTSVVQAYVEGLDPNDFFEGNAPIISFVNPSGDVGAQGLVSIKITNSDGTLFVNGSVSVASTTGASQVSSTAGGLGSNQTTVTTSADGIAQVYLTYTNSTPNEILSISLPNNGTWSLPGNATKITLGNPLLPKMMAEIIGTRASKYGLFASQYVPSNPVGWNIWDPYSHRTFLPTSPQKFYRTMTIASGIGTITALDGTQTSSGPFTTKYTMVDEQTPIIFQSDAPYWFPGDVGPTIIDSVTSAHFNTLRLDLFQKGTTAIFPHVTMELGDEYTTPELITNGLASGGTFTGSLTAVDYVAFSYGLHPEETQFDNHSVQFQFVWNTQANLNVPLTATWLITYTPFLVSGQPDTTPVCTTVTAPVVDGKTELQTFVPPRDKYGSYTIKYIAPSMAVDANRDGQIKEDASDTTSADKPFRFWSNDDDDNPDETPEVDYNNILVDGASDLKDFFPVFLDIKQLLTVLPPSATIKYKLSHSVGALKFVYTSLTRTTAFDYKTAGPSSTGYGDSAALPATSAPTRLVPAGGIELNVDFLDRIKNQDQGIILVEGCTPSAEPLVLTVEKNDVVIVALPLYLMPVGLEIMRGGWATISILPPRCQHGGAKGG